MSHHYNGKFIKVKSDYAPDTYMKIVHNSEGDVIFKIYGNGEMRIALSGGQFHGKKLCAIIDAVKTLMDAISMEEDTSIKKAGWRDTSRCDGYNCNRGKGCSNYEDQTEPLLG